MTTRKGFFTALLTIATAAITKAQQTIITPCRPKIQWGNQIPLCNGQCPNDGCDYMAPPFPAQLSRAAMPEQVKLGMIVWNYNSGFVAGENAWIASHRINRCPKCNTAYWQDPTEAK